MLPPDGSGDAEDLNNGTIIYDGGISDPGFVNNGNGGKKASGTSTDYAKFLFSIGMPEPGYTYTMTYDPDFSELSLTGKLAMVGFGFKRGNAYHFTGLRGDGDTGLNAYKAYGSNFKKLQAGTVEDGGAVANGTQAGPNWIQVEIAEDGTSYTLRTSADGDTWDDEFTDDLPTPLSEATDATDFGLAIYLDASDKGPFEVDITLWEQAAAVDVPESGVLTDDFGNNGATSPNYGLNMLPALHDSGSNRTYYIWEGWDGTLRGQYFSYWDHTADAAGNITSPGHSALAGDDHGNPSIALDHQGHAWAFFGSHGPESGSAAKVVSTAYPVSDHPDSDSGSLWVARTSHTGSLSYPKPHAIGTGLCVFYRETVSGSNSRYLISFETTALADGVPTWAAGKRLIDFGANTRVYAGNTIIRGTEIHFLAAIADLNDTIREHVYYFIYDTADGSLSNWDGSTSTTSGSLPVDVTLANSDYRIFEHTGGNGGTVAGLAFDTDDEPHVLFSDGAGSSYALKHMTVAAGAWTTPETLDTHATFRDLGAIGPLPTGKMEAVYPKDEDASFTVGGTAIYRREMSAAGVWGDAHTLLEADTKALSAVNPVRNAHTDARFTWCEIAASSADSAAGGLRTFVWGASGLLARVALTPFVPADATGNLLLGADQLTLGADNLTIDTTV